MIRTETLKVTTTGSAGSATGSATTPSAISGEILGVLLNFHASLPATADTTIATAGEGTGPAYSILVVTNSATDGYFAPRKVAVDAANSAIAASWAPFAVADKLTISIAQGDALTNALVATIFYDDKKGFG